MIRIALRLGDADLEYLRNVRLQGSSGVRYQIDVLAYGSGHLVIIECKDHKLPVTWDIVAAFTHKCTDIARAYPYVRVSAAIVSSTGFNAGAVLTRNTSHKFPPSGSTDAVDIRFVRLSPNQPDDYLVAYDYTAGKSIICFDSAVVPTTAEVL